MKVHWTRLAIMIFLTLSIGALGSLFTASEIETWYSTLDKPFFNPPNWIFGPVWTFLYISMGVAGYLIWDSKSKKELKRRALIFFFLQLLLNLLWSIIFFGLHELGVAVVEILILWGVILSTILYFRRISLLAAYLLYPYLAWVSFASLLTIAIYLLN